MKSTHIYIEDARGRRVHRSAVATTSAGLIGALAPFRRALRVAVEAGGQTVWIVEVLRELGAAVHVVHPLTVKWSAESKKKTDRVDAELLAGLLRIGGLPAPVHVPSRRSRELRGLLLARRQLVQTRTKLINVVRGLARQQQVTLPARALQRAAGWERLSTRPLSAAVRHVVEAYRATVEATTAALKALEQELDSKATADPRIARLQSVPGVGRVSAQTLVATVDTIRRFPGARQLVAYSGLVPSVRASGERIEYGPITKQGRSEIRAVWVQAAHAVLAVKDPIARVGAGGKAAREEDRVGRAGPEAGDDRVSSAS
jgi:transposase